MTNLNYPTVDRDALDEAQEVVEDFYSECVHFHLDLIDAVLPDSVTDTELSALVTAMMYRFQLSDAQIDMIVSKARTSYHNAQAIDAKTDALNSILGAIARAESEDAQKH